MTPPSANLLWDKIVAAGLPPQRYLSDAENRVALRELDGGTSINHDIAMFRDRSVLIHTERQMSAMLAVIELDGIARRIVLCPSDLAASHLPAVLTDGKVEFVLSDHAKKNANIPDGVRVAECGLKIARSRPGPVRDRRTEWLLFTSGTTGTPKMVVHSLDSLAGPLDDGLVVEKAQVWSSFYDIRRYGGLQILMRALLGGGSMVLSDYRETPTEFLTRAGANGVTHISGTPSHWRGALMSPAIGRISPAYVRLSGEVVDQAILNSLRRAFPLAAIAHAFASTEAGVAFDVRDGLAGFPETLIGQPGAKAEMRIQDGSLHIRSSRTASHYATNRVAQSLTDAQGFVDTGDMVERRGGRYYFVGRREGQINVGGQKVHPEEVEAVVNMHPDVQMSLVKCRASPITGAIVVADVVIKRRERAAPLSFNSIREEILATCRQVLPAYKVPAMLRQVPSLEIAPSGKMLRSHA